ncbi:MAG: GNAT family N-acetyltransferase [Gemmatimonadaceae bacterium]
MIPIVRRYRDADWSEWRRMGLALFPHETADDIESGMREFVVRDDGRVFVAERQDGSACGFVEVGSRPYADGCTTSPVGYIEAWFVDPDVRRQGYGRALLAAAEDWARSRGYREMASDTQLHNEVSREAHERSGYAEVDRIIQFRKLLT